MQEAINKIDTLRDLLHQLTMRVTEYETNLNSYIPQDYPEICTYDSRESSCTRGEVHAISLEYNVTRIRNNSEYTISYATDFLNNLEKQPDIDFEYISGIAMEAISISNTVLELLPDTELLLLQNNVTSLLNYLTDLSVNSTSLYSVSQFVNVQSDLEYNNSLELIPDYIALENDLNAIRNDVQELESRPNYTSEALLVQSTVSVLLSTLQDVNASLNSTRAETDVLESNVLVLRETINDTKEILEEVSTEGSFEFNN